MVPFNNVFFKFKLELKESIAYDRQPEFAVNDLRNAINTKNSEGSNKYYKPESYNQVFGNMFVKDLSIIDLIFCAGPEASKIIYNSAPGR